jgi:hypothetical protein
MKTYDFIKQAIGCQVYLTNDRDLAHDGELRPLIKNKTPLTLLKLTKAGMALVRLEDGTEYSVRPSNVREVGN